MPPYILRPTMHDDVGAPQKRILQPRRRKRSVNAEQRPSRVRALREFPNLERLTCGIQGGFEMHDVALS